MDSINFLRTLYPNTERGILNIWTLEDQVSHWLAMRDIDSKLLPLLHTVRGGNTYFSVGLQASKPDSGRGTSADVVAIPGFWIDVDTLEGVHSQSNLPRDFDHMISLLAGYPDPSLVVSTGGGYHVYWLFDKPIFFMDSSEMQRAVSGFSRAIKNHFASHGLHMDTVSDLARVLRLPGTTNYKDRNNPKPCKVVVNNDVRYTLEELSQYIEEKKQSSFIAHEGTRLTIDQGREMLSYIPKQLDYMDWVHILYALYIEYGPDDATILAEEWSPGYSGEIASKMESFEGKEYNITAGTLIYHAKQHGWKPVAHEWGAIPISETQNSRYVQFDLSHRILMVRSAKGTGKTEQLRALLENTPRVLLIGHRNALLQATAKRLNLSYHHESDIGISDRLAITLDSLPKIGPNAQYDVVLLDESEQVLQHATGSTLKESRLLAMEYLSSVLRQAKHVIALDADLSPVTYNYIVGEIPDVDVYIVDNTYKMSGKTFTIFDTKPAWIDRFMLLAGRGHKLFVAANSRQAVKTLDRMVREKHPDFRILTITADNSMEDEIQAIIADINRKIVNYDIVIVSPSIGTGVSIDVEHFDQVFVLGESDVNTHADLLQQAARVRNIISGQVYCWISPKKNYLPEDPTTIRESCLLNYRQTATILGVQLTPQNGTHVTRCASDDRYINLYADVTAMRNASLNNLRASFISAVKREGFSVIDAIECTNEDKVAARVTYKAASDAVKEEWYEAVATAPAIEYEEYRELRAKTHLTQDERAIVHKHAIQEFYGVESYEITADIVSADSEGLRSRVFALSLLLDSPDTAYKLDMMEHEKNEQHNGRYRVSVPDRGHYSATRDLRLEMLRQAGIDDIVDYAKSGAAVIIPKQFSRWAKDNEIRIYGLLKIRVRGDIDKKPLLLLSAMLEQLGIVIQGKQSRNGQKVVRTYTIAEDSLRDMTSLVHKYRMAREARKNVGEWNAMTGGKDYFMGEGAYAQ